MKTCRNSGLRRAQSMYHGRATAQNVAIATGCARWSAARHCDVASAQMATAPPERITAAGPFASTPNPSDAPHRIRIGRSRFLVLDSAPSRTRSAPARVRALAAQTIARVIAALNSMSGVAARENAIAATLVEKITGASRAELVDKSSSLP